MTIVFPTADEQIAARVRGHAPLWEYFSRPQQALELMSAPKGVGPQHSRTFLLQSGNFWGCRSGAMGADHGPPKAAAGHRLRGSRWGRSSPLLWQYFSRLLKKRIEMKGLKSASTSGQPWPLTARVGSTTVV